MSINFPNGLDSLSNPTATDSLVGHAQQHDNVNDAIEAIQAKLGIDGSNNTSSIDYRIAQLENEVNGQNIGEILGLSGNNSLTITGIENKTSIDSFSHSEYRSAEYKLQITKGSDFYASKISVLCDISNINVSEFDILSTSNSQLANISFEEISGIIHLYVTPISGSVTARFYRTALKA